LPPSNLTFLPNPQTAADLLEGLLRSQLFAESIYGQIFEQSRPFLKYSAREYASALVQRKVLTGWQAEELLTGQMCFYSGTYRLLERLTSGAQSSVFVAEQAGAQRLVLLEATPLNTAAPVTQRSGRSEVHAVRKHSTLTTDRHPHLARCIQTQTTADLSLMSYEFFEGALLREITPQEGQKKSHSAHLVLQLAALLAIISRKALESFDLNRVFIDTNGQLKWLTGPRAMVDDWSTQSPAGTTRAELQMLAIRKFARLIGGLPEMERCRSLTEVTKSLNSIAEPWTNAFGPESIRCTRSVLNRHLRKGPSLKQIESFHTDRQFKLSAPLHKRSPSAPALDTPDSQPMATVAVAPVAPQTELRPQAAAAPSAIQAPTFIPPLARHRTLLLTAVIGAIVSGFIAMQWMWRGSVPEAKAQTESSIDSTDSPDKTR
jgi:hypothetical protein